MAEQSWTNDVFWRVQQQFGAVGMTTGCDLPPLKPLTSNVEYAGCSLRADGSFVCNNSPPPSHARTSAAPRHDLAGCTLGVDGKFACVPETYPSSWVPF